MALQVISQRDAEFAAFALREVVQRLRERGKDSLADSATRVADGLKAGGVIVADGNA